MLEKELYVLNCGHEACAPGHAFGPTVRSHYLIHYVCRGRGIFEAHGKRWPVGPGQGFLILPGQMTYYAADVSEPWEYRWVGYMGPLAAALTHRARLSQEQPLFTAGPQGEIGEILAGIDRDTAGFSRSGLSQQSALGGLLRFMARIAESGLALDSLTPVPLEGAFEKACWFFQGRLDRQVTVEEAAAFVGLSRSQLFRVFKATAGISPKAYLVDLKLRKAQELLAATSLSIQAVSLSAGFQSPAHFTALFQKHLGLTPSAYRLARGGSHI